MASNAKAIDAPGFLMSPRDISLIVDWPQSARSAICVCVAPIDDNSEITNFQSMTHSISEFRYL